MNSIPQALTAATLARGIDELSARDAALARVVADLGPPPMWGRKPGFACLVHIILEQQVSLASARAAFVRLCAASSPLTPEGFLELDDATLREIGFSRQKTAYGRDLARAILSGRLNLAQLKRLDDDAARAALIRVKGIGSWTADIYLLMALRRPDIWPRGDLALATAIRDTFGLNSLPSGAQLDEIGGRWRPWRAVAARILWHSYLQRQAPGLTKERVLAVPTAE